jgi:CysZ protein
VRDTVPRGVFVALARSIPALFSARIVAVVFLPIIASAVLWAVIGWFAWQPLTRWLGAAFPGGDSGWNLFAAGASAVLLLMLMAVLTALVAVAVLAMPAIVDTVSKRDFAPLEKRRGGSFAGSLVNALVAVALFLPLWLLALFLLALPPVYLSVTLLLNAWFNQRLFRYDALALHADADELPAVIRIARGRLFALGLVLAPLSLIPFVNLLAPLLAGTAFCYLCLDELAAFRARNATDPATTRN